MPETTPEAARLAADLGRRYGVGENAVLALWRAVEAGGGAMAQFDHPELGGMGQWSRGGMTMIGAMSDHALKGRVQRLCDELANHVGGRSGSEVPAASRQSQSQGARGSAGVAGPSRSAADTGQPQSRWWPSELGEPASTGSQNDTRYAAFPAARRLAVQAGGRTTVYDTADHRISGFSQQQGGTSSATFTSQHGTVRLADLRVAGQG
jgi:hypothetical protein